MVLDDLALVQRAKAGDRSAFAVLVERYQKKVFAIALGMVKDREDALDVVQEVFVKLYRHLDRFKGDSSFYTWTYRICTNVCIDMIRRKATQRSEPTASGDEAELDLSEDPFGGDTAQSLGDPQRAVLQKELAEQIQAALSAVPEKHRAILLLREVEGMSYEQIAEALSIPKGTVMSRLFHARAKVQKILSEYRRMDGLVREAKKG